MPPKDKQRDHQRGQNRHVVPAKETVNKTDEEDVGVAARIFVISLYDLGQQVALPDVKCREAVIVASVAREGAEVAVQRQRNKRREDGEQYQPIE